MGEHRLVFTLFVGLCIDSLGHLLEAFEAKSICFVVDIDLRVIGLLNPRGRDDFKSRNWGIALWWTFCGGWLLKSSRLEIKYISGDEVQRIFFYTQKVKFNGCWTSVFFTVELYFLSVEKCVELHHRKCTKFLIMTISGATHHKNSTTMQFLSCGSWNRHGPADWGDLLPSSLYPPQNR